jgi:dTMP kinase
VANLPGKFISVEGGEGVGKSLFSKLLNEALSDRGITVVTSHEPGGTPLAQKIRELFKNPPEDDPILPKTELFLVSAARAQHLGRKINPALKRGDWVLCDRFFDSTRVYQGIMGGLPEDTIESILTASTDGVIPDLTFLLDCDTELALARIGSRNSGAAKDSLEQDRFDSATREWHEKLKSAWLKIANLFPDRIVVLDASLAPEALLSEALIIMAKKIGGFDEEG